MADDLQIGSGSKPAHPTSAGAIKSIATTREVKIYGITEDELELISGYNTEAAKFWAASASIFTIFLAAVWDLVPTTASEEFDFTSVSNGRWIFLAIFLIVSIACAIQAYSYGRKRISKLDKIRKASKTIE